MLVNQKKLGRRANNKGTEVPLENKCLALKYALLRHTNIRKRFEFSKFNSLIFKWFRKWRRVKIRVMEGG